MATATGTDSSSANTELKTVTTSRSRMPNRRLVGSEVWNSELVRKLTWFARSDGIACDSRKMGDQPR